MQKNRGKDNGKRHAKQDLKARMQTLTAGNQIFCFQTKHERVDRSVFEPLVYGALRMSKAKIYSGITRDRNVFAFRTL